MSNPTKEELFEYASKKAVEAASIKGKYVHRNIYKAFVCMPISEGIATTYEDVDKLIKESTTTNPKSTDEQIYDQLEIEQNQLDKEFDEWYAQLNEEQIAVVKQAFTFSQNCGYKTLDKINNL